MARSPTAFVAFSAAMTTTTSLQFRQYAQVVLDVSVGKPLDYGIPPEFVDTAVPGARVEVPLRGQKKQGTILRVSDRCAFAKVKAICRVTSDKATVTGPLFELAQWMCRYYDAPLDKVLRCILPASIRRATQAKEQLFVMRAQTREKLRELCVSIRNKSSAQAAVLDAMLTVKSGMLLSELLEQAQVSRSPVMTLVKKGALKVDVVRVDRSILSDADYFKTRHKTFTEEQQHAFDNIVASMNKDSFEAFLVHGVTGSGKTEIYLQAIDRALSQGKGAIMLVPEIALTAQTIERFRSRFDERIAILHHRLSHGERADAWGKIHAGEAKIVIGARSAIFSPVPRLGLIIVDEEHEHSYKQSDETPCYNARDVAVMRGKLSNATVVLGSATPSLESYGNATHGKYTLLKLLQRADNAYLPTVRLVDMRIEDDRAKRKTTFSDALINGIKKRMEIGEQSLLFLNRRGYHTTLLCEECSEAIRCEHCSVALTYHRKACTLSCHLCGFSIAPPRGCPTCHADDTLKFRGIGTEQVERALHAILPAVRSLRLDADTTRHKGSHQRLLHEFRAGKADVLIGTQMIAKGLHFPQVTLVGVLNSDNALQIPDFRASEQVFQLVTQVAGRAGRAVLPGEVLIQSRMPENGILKLAAKQDYTAFVAEELETRKAFGFPPFTRLVKYRFSGPDDKRCLLLAEHFRASLLQQVGKGFALGPVQAAGHAKVKDRYFFQFLARGQDVYHLNRTASALRAQTKLPNKCRLLVDVDPVSTFF